MQDLIVSRRPGYRKIPLLSGEDRHGRPADQVCLLISERTADFRGDGVLDELQEIGNVLLGDQ